MSTWCGCSAIHDATLSTLTAVTTGCFVRFQVNMKPDPHGTTCHCCQTQERADQGVPTLQIALNLRCPTPLGVNHHPPPPLALPSPPHRLASCRRGQMQKAFEEATYALAVGELSQPVFSDSGVHLILRTG